jgi:hypothetical protein
MAARGKRPPQSQTISSVVMLWESSSRTFQTEDVGCVLERGLAVLDFPIDRRQSYRRFAA